MFLNKHKKSDIFEDCIHFLRKIEKLKLYMVKFNKSDTMKSKLYPFNYIINSEKYWPIIVTIHNKCTCSANDSI